MRHECGIEQIAQGQEVGGCGDRGATQGVLLGGVHPEAKDLHMAVGRDEEIRRSQAAVVVAFGVQRHQGVGDLTDQPGGFGGRQRPGLQDLFQRCSGFIFVDEVRLARLGIIDDVKNPQEA